jgi:SAM-dependent methyltransferase
MNAPAHGYIHADTPFDLELARLRLLEDRYDEITRRRLEVIGPLIGARCLEVGAGAGSVARMLATTVGPGGSVVATDVDPRFLSDLAPIPGAGPIEVRRHDIVADDLEVGGFDLVHCRALLLHLPKPEQALARMADALRPGGWLLVEDADFTSFRAAQSGHPMRAHFDRVTTRMFGCYAGDKQMDIWFGRRLPGLMDALGLVARGDEVLEFQRVGGGPVAELFRQSFEQMRSFLVSEGQLREEEFEQVQAALVDPDFTFIDSLNVASWGRRSQLGYLG